MTARTKQNAQSYWCVCVCSVRLPAVLRKDMMYVGGQKRRVLWRAVSGLKLFHSRMLLVTCLFFGQILGYIRLQESAHARVIGFKSVQFCGSLL